MGLRMPPNAQPSTPETPNTLAAPAPESTTPPPAAPAATQVENPSGEGAPDPAAPPAYTPNWKYTVLGKEMELPEDIRAFIKSEKEEKLFRDLYEKSGAVDHFKGKNTQLSEQNTTISRELAGYKEGIQELRTFYQKGDLDSFFERLDIPEEKILQWAAERARLYQDPAQRQAWEARRQAEKRAYADEKAHSSRQQELEQAITQMKVREFRSVLSRPEVKAYAAEFDKAAGKPGSFAKELIRRGDMAYQDGEDLTAEEVANQIMSLYKLTPAQAPSQGAPAAGQGGTKEPPVIPNLGGKSASPIKKPTPKSIADLHKIREQLAGNK